MSMENKARNTDKVVWADREITQGNFSCKLQQRWKLHSAATKDIPLWHARRIRRPGSPQMCLLARAAALPTYINDSGRAGRRVHGLALELRVGKQAGNIPRASSLNISPCVYAESGEAFPCTPGPLHKVGPEKKTSTPVPP